MKVLVLFSGGQDSTTCLGYALQKYKNVECISFLYGQRHQIELQQARLICEKLKVTLKIIDCNDILNQVCESALLQDGDINGSHKKDNHLPASFVPNRNQFFLTLAHSYAQKIDANIIITGVCEADYSGYYDCRQEFISKLEGILNLGSFADNIEKWIKIETPLMNLTKAEIFLLAKNVDILNIVLQDSHTCYEGSRILNQWGAGCGKCPSCLLRKKGYEEFLILN